MSKIFQFPKNFYWGAATSSHQVEGSTHNNWTEWEQKNAQHLAETSATAFQHNPHWKEFEKEATHPQNYISGLACDHWNRYEADFDLLVSLGLNAYRFSLEWSRIEPEEGVFDEEALTHYESMLEALKSRGITPFVTLWHWTLPLWLAHEGGITTKDFPFYFERYTRTVVERLGKHIHFWITLNEPDVVASHSYLLGAWPPQRKSFFAYQKATRRLIQAHKQSYEMIKAYDKNNQVGIAKHQVAFVVLRPTLWNHFLKACADWFWNRSWLRKIRHHQDFIGLNHYHRHCIDNWYGKNPNEIQTDFGWEYYPESLLQVLLELKRWHLPIYVTENGLADAKDTLRQDFIPRTLRSLAKAMDQGADVRGYLHWSFLDNFEWDKGFWLRFGLIEIDRENQKRTIRPSAFIYRDIIKNGSIEV